MKVKDEIVIEVCATSIMSAIAADKGGAGRIELCDNIHEGGTTPSYGSIKMATEITNLDVCILLRPRGGDFLYTDIEFEVMKQDIRIAKELGAVGIVTGILNSKGSVDLKRMQELIDLARPMQVVFHRAFDLCSDPIFVLNQLMDLGIDRLLTSGQQNKVMDGASLIRELVNISEGRIDIMPGSGINTSNFIELVEKTGARNFHLTGRSPVFSDMQYQKEEVILNSFNHRLDFEWLETNSEIIAEIVRQSKLVNKKSP